MRKEDLLSEICSHPLFDGVNPQTLADVLDADAVADFSAGQEIYSPQDLEKKLGIVLSGTASVFSPDEKGGVLLRTLEKGDTFGVATLFSHRDRFVSLIVAKKACRILFFSEASAESLLCEDAAFRMNYVRFLSDRICFLNTKISCFTAGSPERKLAFFLMALEEGDSPQYTVSLNANALSDMLNVGRASLYRAFDKLESEGLIKKDGKTITVLDKNTLRQRYF